MTVRQINSLSLWLLSPLAIVGMALNALAHYGQHDVKGLAVIWMAIVIATAGLLLILKLRAMSRERQNSN
jgi:hypothetical protein